MTDATHPPKTDELKELTAFQRDILRAIAHEGPQKGLAIKSWLEQQGHGEIHHGRLYPNLDKLQNKGYVSKTPLNKRANEYGLTEDGQNAVYNLATGWRKAVNRIDSRQ